MVAGVSMAIRIDPSAYRGVALRVAGLEDGRFHYEVKLLHRDPDLSVPLAEGEDVAAAEAQWREWVGFLGLPALVGRTASADVQVNIDWRRSRPARAGLPPPRQRDRRAQAALSEAAQSRGASHRSRRLLQSACPFSRIEIRSLTDSRLAPPAGADAFARRLGSRALTVEPEVFSAPGDFESQTGGSRRIARRPVVSAPAGLSSGGPPPARFVRRRPIRAG